MDYAFRQIGRYSSYDLDWWRYFHRYLFGREADYLTPLLNYPTSSWEQLITAAFSLPVEAVMAAIGLYFLLPSASWPAVIAIGWKLILYIFLVVLFGGAISTAARLFRSDWSSAASRMIIAGLAACTIPIGIFCLGLYWAAGKGLAIIAPLLFVVLVLPLLKPLYAPVAGRAASALFVMAHLGLGVLRSINAGMRAGLFSPVFLQAQRKLPRRRRR